MKAVVSLFILLIALSLNAQEVSVSSELNLRNYFAYELLGEVDDRIIIYRDRGYAKEIDVFNEDMEKSQTAELILEKKRVDVFNVCGLDSVFQVLYGYFEKDTFNIKYRTYDRSVQLTDSLIVAKIPKKDIRKKFTYAISENKQKILLSSMDSNDNIIFLLYDSKKRKIEWSKRVFVEDDVRNELASIEISNRGDFVLPVDPYDWTKGRDDLKLIVFSPSSEGQKVVVVKPYIFYGDRILVKFNNTNNHLVLAGTYSEKRDKGTKGYYYLDKSVSELMPFEQLTYLPFKESLYSELLQGKKKKNKVLDDIMIQDVIFRSDGGLVFISEVIREYARRNPYSSYARDEFSRRGWVDFYNDDIIVTNVAPDGNTAWNKVLYKKQFSQDDEAIYSSFFIMKTPSRLRFIYNDEIKKNNTVSEYLMDPIGKIARNSLLSTEYQDMKLRFKDAVQVSSSSIIVPSENSYDLNIVRITY